MRKQAHRGLYPCDTTTPPVILITARRDVAAHQPNQSSLEQPNRHMIQITDEKGIPLKSSLYSGTVSLYFSQDFM